MIRKSIKITVVLLAFALLLCGCKSSGEDSKPNDKRFVSAIGFDEENGEIIAAVEAIEAVGEGKVNPYVLKSRGENVAAILTELESESPRELSFTHAAAVVFGESLSKKSIEAVLGYFISEEKIPLSAKVVAAEDAAELLSFKKGEKEASGYEVSDVLERMSEELGIGAHSTLYEIKTASMQTVNIYALPILEEDDKSLEFEGMRVYVDNIRSAEIDYEQSVAYAVIRNIFDGGEVYSENGVYTVSSATADIKADFSSDRLKIDIIIKSNPDSDELIRIIKDSAEDFEQDIFGISNVLAERYPDIWSDISEAYGSYYKNAEINVIKE